MRGATQNPRRKEADNILHYTHTHERSECVHANTHTHEGSECVHVKKTHTHERSDCVHPNTDTHTHERSDCVHPNTHTRAKRLCTRKKEISHTNNFDKFSTQRYIGVPRWSYDTLLNGCVYAPTRAYR